MEQLVRPIPPLPAPPIDDSPFDRPRRVGRALGASPGATMDADYAAAVGALMGHLWSQRSDDELATLRTILGAEKLSIDDLRGIQDVIRTVAAHVLFSPGHDHRITARVESMATVARAQFDRISDARYCCQEFMNDQALKSPFLRLSSTHLLIENLSGCDHRFSKLTVMGALHIWDAIARSNQRREGSSYEAGCTELLARLGTTVGAFGWTSKRNASTTIRTAVKRSRKAAEVPENA